jgi:hypothetical protein
MTKIEGVASHRVFMSRRTRETTTNTSFLSHFFRQEQIRLIMTSIIFSSPSIHGKYRAALSILFTDFAEFNVTMPKRGQALVCISPLQIRPQYSSFCYIFNVQRYACLCSTHLLEKCVIITNRVRFCHRHNVFFTLPSELGSDIGFYVLRATHFDVIWEHFFRGGFKALVPIRTENKLSPGMYVHIFSPLKTV